LLVYRLRKDVPLLTVSRAGKPRVGRNADVARIKQQTGVRYVFDFHKF
jgi:hypothetical protein